MGMRLLIGRFFTRAIQNSTTHTRHSWGVCKFQIFTSKMHYYVTWDTFVFLQVSMPRWYGKRTIVELLSILESRKQWQYCRSISIGQTFDRMSGSTSDPALLVPLPNLQQPFEIETNAYDYDIGAVLTQQGHPMAYHNEIISNTAHKYLIMTKKCIPLCRLADNGSIEFWGRKQSSTQITNPYSSYRHKGSCRTITIINGPHTYNSSIWTSSTRMEEPITS